MSDNYESSQQHGLLDRATNPCENANASSVKEKATNVTAVKRSVILVLVFGAVVGTCFVWACASNKERQSFRVAFDSHASRLMGKLIVEIETKVAVVSSLSVSFTSSMKKQPWPNVTMPDFHEHCQIPLHSSTNNWIAFAPIVQADQRDGWEAYAIETEKIKHSESEVNAGELQGPKEQFITEYGA